ncbi:SURF1 family cytochrome oxidase biogenesis protein [Sphingomonas sp. BK235]|uniref:SURF1 family cytochrome oxidase biogenesis protein n=1 Tax=Sphingomonas sp. BK235 TaxID=2512131 RepID=UPI001047E109|nr:SURF1 family cytochrome oxidase biogenesis protein [Sphingomonas sp. BK235]TCP35816.1 surfeit locus 1 family protein [Sphingomonas sp. BK235]
MRRVPVVPTLLVALAAAVMVALGLWQLLERKPQKEALLAQLAANPGKPPIAFPRFPDDALLFRRASAFCLQPVGYERAGAGAAGFRVIALCRTGAEGPGLRVQIGTTRDAKTATTWRGGEVRGWIAHAPDARPLIATVMAPRARELMLVSDSPAPGLAANTPPDPSSVPNNHLAYAVQWFLFAAVAVVVYVVALRRRGDGRVTPHDPPR